jgi:uncharacterized protein (TIGR03435 family)
MSRAIFFAGLSLLTASAGCAQTAAQPLRFQVASIKPSDPAGGRTALSLPGGESLAATNATLRALITFACDVRDPQLTGGPAWMGTDRYDVIAKTAAGEQPAPLARAPTNEEIVASDNRTREKTRSMLAERFGLVVHREMREQSVYLLTIAKGGSKLRENETADRHETTRGRGRNEGHAATMAMLTGLLSSAAGHPVVDRTGLAGNYDWLLEWSPDRALSNRTPRPLTQGQRSLLRSRRNWGCGWNPGRARLRCWLSIASTSRRAIKSD